MAEKRVLVVWFSQTGQLQRALSHSLAALKKSKNIRLTHLQLRPKKSFPFPWSVMSFMGVFPESVYCKGVELEEFDVDDEAEFDLIILAYQVWFLSPSLPMSAFMQSPQAAKWLKGRPVVTFIACRNMWLEAQEKMKNMIAAASATLIDNIALVDGGSAIESFITTPRWLLTGRKGAFWRFSEAGVSERDMIESARFGARLAQALGRDEEKLHRPLLKGLGAVNVDERLIMSERIGHRSFLIWGKFLMRLGKPDSVTRKVGLSVYLVFLVLMILTVVPVSLLIRRLFYPLMRSRLAAQKAYFEEPSGSLRDAK